MTHPVQPALQFLQGGSSGPDGRAGLPGADGGRAEAGYSGEDGKPGEPGQPGSDLNLQLQSDPSSGRVWVTHPQGTSDLPLGDPNIFIQIDLSGGDGGSGGRGGNGGVGGQGLHGRNATRQFRGGNGKPGARGGNGGNGGAAAPGGDGGDLLIQTSPDDTDLLLLCPRPKLQGGKAGRWGQGGGGGRGGPGGPGGKSHHWTTQYTTYTTGPRGNRTPHWHTQHHSQPGGHTGPEGANGTPGAPGEQASKGADGSYQVQVDDGTQAAVYPSPYELEFTNSSVEPLNGNGVFEPGMLFQVHIGLRNRGQMPSPSGRVLTHQIQDQNGLETVETPTYSEPLQAGQKVKLAKPIIGRVKELPQVPNGEPYDRIHRAYYRTVMSRVNRPCPLIDQQYSELRVRFPIKAGPLYTPPCLTGKDEVPLALRIYNVSTQALGVQAQARSVTLRLSSDYPMLLRDREGTLHDLGPGATIPIQEIQAEDSTVFSGSLRLGTPAPPAYEQVKIQVELFLGDKPIQIREIQLQVAEPYRGGGSSDLLFVVNHKTSKAEIDRWKNLAHSLGFQNPAFWNLSLYEGFNFSQETQWGRNLMQDFKNKTVVFINNQLEDKEALSKTKLGDFLRAASEAKVRTCFLGEVPARLAEIGIPRKELEIQRTTSLGIPEKPIKPRDLLSAKKTQRYWCCHQPNEKDLQKKALDKNRRLEDQLPHRCFQVIYDYQPQLQGNCLTRSGALGSIHLCEQAPREEVLWLNASKEDPARALLQLLPFEQKLTRWTEVEAPYRKTLEEAILWDLILEQSLPKAPLKRLIQWRDFVDKRTHGSDAAILQRLNYALKHHLDEKAACGCFGGQNRARYRHLAHMKKALGIDKDYRKRLKEEALLLSAEQQKWSPETNLSLKNRVLKWEEYENLFPYHQSSLFVEKRYEGLSEFQRLRILEDWELKV